MDIEDLSPEQQSKILMITQGGEARAWEIVSWGSGPHITEDQLGNLTLGQYCMVLEISRGNSIGWNTDPRLTIEELGSLTPEQQFKVYMCSLILRGIH